LKPISFTSFSNPKEVYLIKSYGIACSPQIKGTVIKALPFGLTILYISLINLERLVQCS